MIDLKLAKEIGATHHGNGNLYKIDSSVVYVYISNLKRWTRSIASNSILENIERINFNEPKPQTKVEYVKCDFNYAWEAVKAVENEEVFYWNGVGKYIKADIHRAIYNKDKGRLYRRVETPINWKDIAREFVIDSDYLNLDITLRDLLHPRDSGDDFGAEADKQAVELIKLIYPHVK